MSDDEKKAIMEHLPEGQQTAEGLRQNLLSPQLRQAMKSLTEACHTSQENVQMIMAMCDLDSSVMNTSNDGIEALIKAFAQKFEKK